MKFLEYLRVSTITSGQYIVNIRNPEYLTSACSAPVAEVSDRAVPPEKFYVPRGRILAQIGVVQERAAAHAVPFRAALGQPAAPRDVHFDVFLNPGRPKLTDPERPR